MEVERGRLRFFAKAIGETSPLFLDEDYARAQGYRGLPAPPTFVYGLEFETTKPFALLNAMGIPIERVLHGDQRIVYHNPVISGDTLTYSSVVTDVYDRPPSPYEFIVVRTDVRNQLDERVAELVKTIVVRPQNEEQ